MSEGHSSQEHTGLITNWKQLLVVGVLAFAVPVFVMSSGKGGELLMGIPSAEALFRSMMVVDAGEGRSTDCVARAVEPTAARPAVGTRTSTRASMSSASISISTWSTTRWRA